MRGFLFAAVFFVSVSFFTPTVFALEKPHQYFDWNRYPAVDSRVLGESDPASSQTTDDYKNLQRPTYFFGFLTNAASDNPLYFLKKLEEGFAITFTFDPQQREQRRFAYAAERLAEMEQLAQKGKATLASNLAADYQNLVSDVAENISNLKKQGKDVKNLLSTVDLEAARHNLILEELALKLPPQAETGIRTALFASEQAMDAASDASGKPAVPEELVQRLQSLKAQGLLTPEEVAKLINVDSRQKAREELRKYTQAGLVPEADFKKLDETARNYFPAAFVTITEVKKLSELKELETQKPDEDTVKKLQEFAKTYKPGEIVPQELRRYWVPMVRLEELQNTVRPDLVSEDFFKYRPEEKQKYQEVVERMKPKKEDVEYVNRLSQQNPNLLNDPSFARIKAIADKFGAADSSTYQQSAVKTCGSGTHWVGVPFMPEGGYCAPNYNYSVTSTGEIRESSCPPSYHRCYPGGPCIPDNPNGSGIIGSLPAVGSCPSGYSWKTESASPRGGYCSPDYVTTSSGGYPGTFSVPAYCPPGRVFREGRCEEYNPPPKEGCPSGSYWNGEKCVSPKNCGPGYYQDSSGECKSGKEEYEKYKSKCAGREMPPGGCAGGYWDMESCSCKTGGSYNRGDGTSPSTAEMKAACERGGCRWTGVGNACECSSSFGGSGGSGTPSREAQEATCRAGGGTCVSWVNGACGCERPGGTYTGGSGGGTNCGSGYYWNGNYCAPSQPPTQPQPTSQPQPQLQPTSPPPSEPQPTSPSSQPTSAPPPPPPAEQPATAPAPSP